MAPSTGPHGPSDWLFPRTDSSLDSILKISTLVACHIPSIAIKVFLAETGFLEETLGLQFRTTKPCQTVPLEEEEIVSIQNVQGTWFSRGSTAHSKFFSCPSGLMCTGARHMPSLGSSCWSWSQACTTPKCIRTCAVCGKDGPGQSASRAGASSSRICLLFRGQTTASLINPCVFQIQ